MMATKYKLIIFGVVFMTMACSLGLPAVQPQTDQVGTVVAATMQALTVAAPAPTDVPPTEVIPTQVTGTPFTFKNVSFVIPQGMADGANAEVAPAATEDQGGPWGAGPEHISIELTGYSAVNENAALKNMILVYPVKEYMDANWGAAKSIPELQAILANPSLPITPSNSPSVPAYNAGQLITARTGIINFQNGSGLRQLTEYAQYSAPITKNGEIYQYTGLTSDGKYFIIVVLPIQTPLLSTGDNPSADGVAFPDMGTADETAFTTYYQTMTDKLNAFDPNAFQPSINQLDAFIQSIQILP
jgi:hypothetical protein